MKPKIKATRAKLQLQLLSFCLLCLSGKTRCDGNGAAVVTVKQNSDAVLPCSPNTTENIEAYHFEWKKAAQKEVFYYDAGITYDSGRAGQSEEFKGRVSHSQEGLTQGNASIIIRNTAVSDSGSYTCDFPDLQPRQTFHIELIVGAAVVTVKQNSDAVLPCSPNTTESIERYHFEWKKAAQKEVFYYDAGITYDSGHPGQSEEFKGRVSHSEEGLTQGNASIIIRNTAVSDSGSYTCDFPDLQPRQTFHIELVVEPAVITVKQDGDALLPCSRSTENIEQGYFYWYKLGQNNDKPKDVFQYEKGQHTPSFGHQDNWFKRRVSHFQEELKHGNASIIIRNTKTNDSGNYTCVFPKRQTFHIKLVVGAAPKPNIDILDETDNRALLQCEVHGNPQPEVEWRDSAGNKLPAQKPQVSKSDGRVYVTVNTAVNKTDRYRCVATQKTISHQIHAEITVRLNGPTPAKVKEGKDVTLPCSLRTKENIESEMFEWKKEGLKEVFFHGGIHYNGNRPGQSEEFKGRVSLFPEELKHGDASITIRNAKMSDSGNYTCDFPRLQPRQTFHIELTVVNDGSGVHRSDAAPKPSVTILKTKDGLLLQCVVRRASPKPKVEWKDSSGKILDAEPQVTDRGGSYDIILQSPVTKAGDYSCVVTQEEINHQTHADIYVPLSGSSTGWIVFLFLLVLLIGVVLAVLVHKGCITLHCNKASRTHQMEASGVPLKDKSASPTAPQDDSKDPLNDKSGQSHEGP